MASAKFLSDFSQIYIFLTNFHKVSNVKFDTYLSSDSLDDTCRQIGGWMDRWVDRQTDHQTCLS
jgi:hypothetical protein